MDLVALAKNPVPSGATTGFFKGHDGIKLRFARWEATRGPRRGTVCLFQGRGEFIEKYFEVVADLRRRGFSVATMDWRGQGGSDRLLSNPRKGHVRSFADFDQDLAQFMKEVVLPDCQPPYRRAGPLDGRPHSPAQRHRLRLVVLAHGALGADDLHRPEAAAVSRAAPAPLLRDHGCAGAGGACTRQAATTMRWSSSRSRAIPSPRIAIATAQRHGRASRAPAGPRLADDCVAQGGAEIDREGSRRRTIRRTSRCPCCCSRPAWTGSSPRPTSRSSACG